MSLSLNKILLASAATNTAGAYLQGVTITSIGIGNTTLMNAGTSSAQNIPAGAYILPQSTNNVAIEVNAYTSAGANAWTTYIAANTGGTIISDGFNVRANATTSTQTLTLYTSNGGNNAPGTYTS
jgi:hypothetical protein